MRLIPKPKPTEYPKHASMYIDLLPDDGEVLTYMRDNLHATLGFIETLPEEKLTYRYAKGKWSIKEILVHLIDDERIYAYRALRFARNDKTVLMGFKQDPFAKYSHADKRTRTSISHELEAVRVSTIELFNNLPEESLSRMGTADGKRSSVRALAYHIAGHELHHIKVINEKYL